MSQQTPGYASRFGATYSAAFTAIPGGGVPTQLNLDLEAFDGLDEYDNVTTHRFTPKEAGYYLIHAVIEFSSIVAGNTASMLIRVTGAASIARDIKISDGVNPTKLMGTVIAYLTPNLGVYVEVQNFWVNPRNIVGTALATNFTAHRLS